MQDHELLGHPLKKKQRLQEEVKLEPREDTEDFPGQASHTVVDMAPSEAEQYERKDIVVTPSTFHQAQIHGFIIRGYDSQLFSSISTCPLYNLFHQSKTTSPIIMTQNFNDLSRIVVLDGSHRICRLLEEKANEETEQFNFEAVCYAACKDFGKVFDNCVEVKTGQTKRTDVPSFPPSMLNLVQLTYGREFSKSLSQFSKKQQAEALGMILDIHIKQELKADIQRWLSKNNASPILGLYRKCFSQGLVASESTDSHVEKSPFFHYFMCKNTGKVFLEEMDKVYAANKCHLLILKASNIKDDDTAKAVSGYLDKSINGKQLLEKLNNIIKNTVCYVADNLDHVVRSPAPTPSLTLNPSTMRSARPISEVSPLLPPPNTSTMRKTGPISELSPLMRLQNEKMIAAKGVVVDEFKVIRVKTLESVPTNAVVAFQRTIPKVLMEELVNKCCSVIVQSVSTVDGLISKLVQFGGNVRFGVCNSSTILGAGNAFIAGDEIKCCNTKMFLIRSTAHIQDMSRKDDRCIYEFVN